MSAIDIIKKFDIKVIDEEEDWSIFKVGTKMHILWLQSNSNRFMMERDIFEYLDSNKLPYSILLFNKKEKKYFYIDLKKGYNWVKACFDSCDKDTLFLGKQIMNYPVTEKEIVSILKKIL